MKPLISLLFVFSSLSSFAQMHIGSGDVCGVKELKKRSGRAVCVCEVQRKSESRAAEYPFYKVGCQKWLASQSCDIRKTIEEYDDLDALLNEVGEISHIKIGYVGHWPSSYATKRYVETRIVPIVKTHNTPVFYDNTACSGANDPIAVRDFLLELPEDVGSKISVKANENISVGEWDSVLKPLVRSNAEITMCTKGLEVPTCRSFENKGCAVSLNHRDTVGCVSKKGQFKVLKCERKREGRIGKFERGRWRAQDIRDLGGVVALDDQIMSRAGAWYNVKSEGKTKRGETISLEDTPVYLSHYDFAHKDTEVVKQKITREVSWYAQEDVEITNVFVGEMTDDTFNKPFKEVYTYRPNNKNHNRRVGPKSLMEHFRDNFNTVVNYYKMHRSEEERNNPYFY